MPGRAGPRTIRAAALAACLLAGACLLAPTHAIASGGGNRVAGVPAYGSASHSANAPELRPVTFQLEATPNSLLAFGVTVNTSMGVSSGLVDQGNTVTATAELGPAPRVELHIGLLNLTSGLSIPALGRDGPIPVPGLTYTYLGVQFNISVSTLAKIQASEVVRGASSQTLGNVSWAAPGNSTFPVTAANDSAAGSNLSASLSDIRYALWISVNATGSVPFLGNLTVPLLGLTQVGNISGSPSSVVGAYTVVADPEITALVATPSTVRVGTNLTLTANVSGGIPPMQFVWTGVPSGCPSSNRSIWTCQPPSVGRLTVTVSVSDSEGRSASRNVSVNVMAPPTGTPAGTVAGLSTVDWAVVGLAIAAALFVGILLGRRRPPLADPDPPEPSP